MHIITGPVLLLVDRSLRRVKSEGLIRAAEARPATKVSVNPPLGLFTFAIYTKTHKIRLTLLSYERFRPYKTPAYSVLLGQIKAPLCIVLMTMYKLRSSILQHGISREKRT